MTTNLERSSEVRTTNQRNLREARTRGIPVPPALLERADLLEHAAVVKRAMRVTWRGVLADLGDYGTTGGSAADYRSIVAYLAALEEHR